jgi:hypothetical protein
MQRLLFAGDPVDERDLLELDVSARAADPRIRANHDPRVALAAIHEIPRHVVRQRRTADEHRHRAGVLRGVERRLAGRVGAADDEHVAVR